MLESLERLSNLAVTARQVVVKVQRPAAHARGESLAWLALIALGGLALLVLNV